MENEKSGNVAVGLDIGANSIGWTVFSCADENEGDYKQMAGLLDAGVRVFEEGVEGGLEALQKGQEQSKNTARRDKRQIRRQLERRAMRTFGVFRLLREQGLLPESAEYPVEDGMSDRQKTTMERAQREEILQALDRQLLEKWKEKLEQENRPEEEILLLPKRFHYVLRARALDEKLSEHELGRVLYQLGQRRGFESNRKVSKKDEDKGKVKKEIENLSQEISKQCARTLGEYYSWLDPDDHRIRNRWTGRQMYKHEFDAIWEAQKKHHPSVLTDEFKAKLENAIFSQRPLKSQKNLIGPCEYEKGKPRAPRACLEFQRFRILKQVNNTRIQDREFKKRDLTEEQRQALIKELETKPKITLTQAKKVVKKAGGMVESEKFNYEGGTFTSFMGNTTTSKIRDAIGEKWDALSEQDKYKLVEDLLSIKKEEALIKRAMNFWGLTEEEAKKLAETEPEDGYCHLSRKAINKLLPIMEEGHREMEAVNVTFDPEPPVPHNFLPPVKKAMPEIRNPAVERVLTELRKVINAIVREYGKPAAIKVEMARDMKKSRNQRKEISNKNLKNQKKRENARNELKKIMNTEERKRRDIEKYLLWEECKRQCPYTGQYISAEALFSQNSRFDIEHIIPFNKSFDNSFLNKTLGESEENRRKGDRTPWQAYSGNPEKYEQILKRAREFQGDAAEEKLRRFMMEDDEFEEYIGSFKTRQLNDTRYASKLAVNYLGMLYGEVIDEEGKRRVHVSNGEITHHVRNALGMNAILNDGGMKTRDDHRHHAVDAAAVTLISQGLIQRMSNAAKKADRTAGHHLFTPIEEPWENFLQDLKKTIDNITVSHRVSRKANGPLHEETNYSPTKYDEKGKPYVHIRKPLEKMSGNDVKNIVDPQVKKAVQEKLKELGKEDTKLFQESQNLPCLTAKDGRKIPIKKARIKKSASPMTVGAGPRERHVSPGSNHHVEIFEVKDKKGKVKWDGEVVSRFEAMKRKKEKQPIVKRDHGPDKKFIFSLALGEVIKIDEENGKRGLYVIRSVFSNINKDKKSPRLAFVKINDARLKKDIKQAGDWKTSFLEPLRKLNCRKVSVDPLGRVRPAND